VSSTIQVELALFNDHLLAWEPLIEPIIDERGVVQSPWAITCETINVFLFLFLAIIIAFFFIGSTRRK
jgi:hypothetical protein